MTGAQFKRALNKEIKGAALDNEIIVMGETKQGYTTMKFENKVKPPLQDWLNKRFKYGVTVMDDPGMVHINPPKRPGS